jgi:superfamily II DNA/RNA helicase
MSPPIKKLSDRFLSHPKSIEVARPATAAASIDQRQIRVDSRRKKDVLVRLLGDQEVRNAIVFCNRKTTVRDLASSLKRSGFAAGQIQGDMEQADRIRELDRFKKEEINILVASDVAARGLDIKGVSHVFNFDVPWHPDDYVHRIGRTGRAGRTGVAISLVGKEDAESIDNIQKLIGTKIAEVGGEPAARDEEAAEAEKPARAEKRGRRERGRRAEPAHAEAPRSERARRDPAPAEAPRSERARRDPAPAAEAPRREERKAKPERRDRREPREPALEAADEGWNGPVPSFLGKGFGS